MKRCMVIATSVVMLLAGASLAAAQDNTPAANPPAQMNNQPAPPAAAQNHISLSDQQKQTIWQTLSKARAETAPADFQAAVGADVPKGLRLHYFKRSLTRQVPATHGYEYAKLQNEVLIVNPKTKKIIGTVSGS